MDFVGNEISVSITIAEYIGQAEIKAWAIETYVP
jgi:hypothetical protein